jgi:pyridoxine kinase
LDRIKNVAALHDLASYGRCSLTCVIPVLSCMGIKVCPIPTAVYSSDTGGFGPVYARELTQEMVCILDKLRAIPARFDGVYSGYLGSPAQAEIVSRFLHAQDCLRVVDPVMGDDGRLYAAFDESMVYAMRTLCRGASVITPNLTEAALLLGLPMPEALTRQEAVDMLDALHRITEGDAVITSALLRDYPDAVCTIARDEASTFAVVAPRVPGTYPGAGDIFTSVLTGTLLRGGTLPEAVRRAAAFVSRCMVYTHAAGTPTREGVLLETCLPHVLDAPEGIRTVSLR